MTDTDRRAPKPRPICPACSRLRDRWLFSRPQDLFPEFGSLTQASAAYDLTPAGVQERRHDRHQRWVSLVRDQMAAIDADCRAGRHADEVVR
jgi:hypothetical protein